MKTPSEQAADDLVYQGMEDDMGTLASASVRVLVAAYRHQRIALQLSAAVFDAIGGTVKAPVAYAAVTEALAK